jgi:hypothetical protein
MRDLGKAMIPALDALVAELDAAIPVLACHQHFVADLGFVRQFFDVEGHIVST